MKRRTKGNFIVAGSLLLLFVLWTVAIQYVDVQSIGPKNSKVGFAAWNGFFHELTGVHMQIYNITDWLGLVPIIIVLGFAILGLVQLIKRRSLRKVDYDILVLGGFYAIVLMAYVAFEICVINYRPVLIDGCLEASYPSSTTLMVMCVMPTAMMQLNERVKMHSLRKCLNLVILLFTAFMVIGRLISGVHWFTDIVGGALLSGGLVMLYYSVCRAIKGKLCRG